MMKWTVIACVLLLAFSACKKKRELTVSGQVTEGYTGQALNDAEVEFAFSELRNATYSLGYTILGSTSTDGQGKYNYSFDRVAAVDYRVRCSKNGYLLYEEFIQTDDWRVGSDNEFDIELFAESSLTFRIYSTSNAGGQLLLRLDEHSQGCEYCCPFDATIRVAGVNDTTFTCSVFGNQTISYKTIQIAGSEVNERYYDLVVQPGENLVQIEY